jgi:acetyl esterase
VGPGHLTLHPDIQAVLDADPAPGPPAADQPLEQMRAEAEQTAAVMSGPGDAVARVESLTVPGPAGRIPVRLYAPAATAGPLLVFCHGGGWVTGSLDSYDPFCRRLANATGALTLSVGYRLAPEHPWPAPLQDVLAVIDWSYAHAAELGAGTELLAVAGDSAGATLATVAARRRRELVRFQALVYPALDPTRSHDSHRAFATGFRLTSADMAWYWAQYLAAADPSDPDVSPLAATDLRGAPPAYVLTAECDPLRDEGEAYARALAAAEVPVELRRWPGTVHGFARWFALTGLAGAAVDELAAALKSTLGSAPLPSGAA